MRRKLFHLKTIKYAQYIFIGKLVNVGVWKILRAPYTALLIASSGRKYKDRHINCGYKLFQAYKKVYNNNN
jgi:hypothetical protein